MSEGKKLRILAADRGAPLQLFDDAAAKIGAEVIYGNAGQSDELESLVEDADAVIVFRTYVPEAAIARMKKCRVILRQGIGFDLVDVPAATRAGIFVSNVPDYCIEEVANHTMTLLLAVVRDLPGFQRVITTRGWGFYNDGRIVPPLAQMRLGLLGLGKIGRAVARRAKAFGLTVAAYDPYVHQDVFDWIGAERVRQLDDLLRSCDILSIHTPLTPETQGMIGRREIGLMRTGSYLINTARGKVVELAALDEALASGKIAGAGLDVFEVEPMDAAHPILKHNNLVATPHIAFYSQSSLVRVVTQAIDEVVRVLEGERPLYLVNPEVYAHRT